MNERFSFYVHTPFCASKCPYCDFISFAGAKEYEGAYFEALSKEIKAFKGLAPKPLDTIYFGGGTPTCVSADFILKAIDLITSLFPIEETYEATIEGNPNSITKEKLRSYNNSGFNRLSIGMQSADGQVLKNIGRLHSHSDTINSIEAAAQSGFSNFSLDLMFALPGQTLASALSTAEFAMASGASHISAYSLTVEEGHKFYGCCDEALEREMCHELEKLLNSGGFERYEISNYCLPGKESRHNSYCWDLEPYKGFGCASHSFVDNKRLKNPDTIKEYISRVEQGRPAFDIAEGPLSQGELAADYRMLSLRTKKGVRFDEYQKNFGKSFMAEYGRESSWAALEGLAEIKPASFSLTSKGFDFANLVISEFI